MDPALEGVFTATLADGRVVEVEPVFARLRRHLEAYTPERAGAICEIHPDNIRALARKVATRRTKIFIGWNSGKYYHGDLMERAMALLLGLTGNWGRKGTGTRSWAIMGLDGVAFFNSLTLAPFGSFQLAPVGGGGNGAFAFGPTGTLLGATWMGDANGTLPGGGVFSQMGAVLCIPISTVATVPLVIMFFIFQRQFVRGIQMTGLRE